MSENSAAAGFLFLFILAIGGIMFAIDPGVEVWELDIYAHGVNVWHTIYEFDTKAQAEKAIELAKQEGAKAYLTEDPRGNGFLWWRKYPVELSGGYEDRGTYLQELESPFRWNDPIGREIIQSVKGTGLWIAILEPDLDRLIHILSPSRIQVP